MDINIPTEKLSNLIYFDAYKEDCVRLVCNDCEAEFFKGPDWEHLEFDWLGTLIAHVIEKHPTVFKTT